MSNQAFATPSSAAAEVLRAYWDQQLPVKVDDIAMRMGIGLHPSAEMGYSGHYYAANDPDNPTGRPAIVFNTNDSAARQRFTVAHELGHHVLGHGTSPRDTSNMLSSGGSWIETAANQFAAEVLMPAHAIRVAISNGYTSVDDLAGICGVSTAAMGYRLINLGLNR